MTITPTLSDAPQVAINDIGSEEDFLAAIDETIKYFNDGDIVEGTIVKVDRDEVLLDIGYKTEGVIPSRELSIKHDVDPNEVVEVGDKVEAVGPAALGAYPAGALPGAGADLEHVAPGDVAEDSGLGLGQALRTPDEPGVAEELAVGGLVLVGVGVPLAAVGAQGLRLRGGPAGRVDAVRQITHP